MALPKIGGQEMVVDALARQFVAAGHETVVLAPNPRRPLVPRDEGLPYPVVRHPRFMSTWRFVGWYRYWLAKVHRRFRFDLVHCHSIHPCGYLAAKASAAWNTPLVITSHGGDVRASSRRLSKPRVLARSKFALAKADALISIGDFTTEGFLHLCPQPKRLETIPNGIDLTPFARPATDGMLAARIATENFLLFLGRLNARKGVDVLLRAYALLLSKHPAPPLVIAGDGEQRDDLKKLAAQLNIDHRVMFMGAVHGQEKVWLLQHARAVVLPTRTWEACPLVALEAFAAGKPVVGSQVPGIAGLVTPGRTGLLVPPESPEALSAALCQIVSQGSLCETWGAEARRSVQNGSWPAVADRHLKLFEELIAGRHNGPDRQQPIEPRRAA
jgi:glycosyltransferase involved in cell wall biosynthesis